MSDRQIQQPVKAKPGRRQRLQFSLAACLTATMVVAVVVGRAANQARRQTALLHEIEEREGVVSFQRRRSVFAGLSWPLGASFSQEYYREVVRINLREKSVSPELLVLIGHCETLQSLDLRRCRLTDDWMLRLRPLKQLTSLDVSCNRLTGRSLDTISEFRRLLNLDLSENLIDDTRIERLEKLDQLISLNLAGTRIQDSGALSIGRLRSLVNLDLSDTGVTPKGLAHLRSLNRLVRLQLDAHHGPKESLGWITDEGAIILREMPSLTHLTLVNQAMTDVGLETVAQLPRLRYLNVKNRAPRFSRSTLLRIKRQRPELTIHGLDSAGVD